MKGVAYERKLFRVFSWQMYSSFPGKLRWMQFLLYKKGCRSGEVSCGIYLGTKRTGSNDKKYRKWVDYVNRPGKIKKEKVIK